MRTLPIGSLALLFLLLLAAPARAEEGSGLDTSTPQEEAIYREGAIFHTGFGGFALAGTTHVDGNSLGGGGYGGFVHIGYWVHDYFSLGIHALGVVGPRHVRLNTLAGGNTSGSFSVIQYAIRSQVHLYGFSPGHDLYVFVAPGYAQTGSSPHAPDLLTPGPPYLTVSFKKHFALSWGAGIRLWRFGYVGTSLEGTVMHVLGSRDKFVVVGGTLTAWVRPRAGLVGIAEENE